MTKYIKHHLLPKEWRDKVEDSEAIETYLSNKKEVTLVGYVKKINGKLYLEADKNKEFVIFECYHTPHSQGKTETDTPLGFLNTARKAV